MRYLVLAFVLLLSTATLAPAPAAAQTPVTPAQALERLFTSPELSADWFEPSFLAVVPLPQAQQVLTIYQRQLGAFRSVAPEGSRYRMRFERGSALATIRLSENGRIDTLIFSTPAFDDPELALRGGLASLRSLPGNVSFYVTRDGTAIASQQPEARLAVGSAFKLAVLLALQDQIAAGKHSWDEVVRLRNEWKSLPTGVLQNWPEGSRLTIETLASQMISISDNTATDALIDIVGRDAIQRYLPGNDPLLTTRQLFLLKSPRLASLLDRYRAADTADKRALLSEIDAQPAEWLSVEGLRATPDVEYFVSARDLCGLIDKVASLDLFRINSGGAADERWRQVAFKGGSDLGVVNLTYQLTALDGTKYCVSATWNDESAEADTLVGAVLQVIQGLR